MTTVFLGGLSDGTGVDDVIDFFRKHEGIRTVNIKEGFGFVRFDRECYAQDAVRDFNGKWLLRRRVRVELSRGRAHRGYNSNGGKRRFYCSSDVRRLSEMNKKDANDDSCALSDAAMQAKLVKRKLRNVRNAKKYQKKKRLRQWEAANRQQKGNEALTAGVDAVRDAGSELADEDGAVLPAVIPNIEASSSVDPVLEVPPVVVGDNAVVKEEAVSKGISVEEAVEPIAASADFVAPRGRICITPFDPSQETHCALPTPFRKTD